MTDARSEILGRIAAALAGEAPSPPAPRAYRHSGSRSPDERVSLFCERVADYRADVTRIAGSDVASAIASACERHGARRLVVPAGVPTAWRPAGLELVDDTGLTSRELDGLDGVLTGCTVAVAETGTIALTGGPAEGRRALSLVPDLHLCVVEEDQIVELVPEAIAVLGRVVADERRPVTLISGPSATSDIELSRVEGVHGPRTLVVFVVGKESP
ncbi:MAG TPA: lactate utilization protein C [Gaiellaceae bacterium]